MIQEKVVKRQSGLLQRLAQAAGIREGEGEAFSLLFGQSFFLGIALITYYSSANALFLSHFSAQKLPYVYIAAAAIIIITGLVFLRLQSTLPFSTLLIGNLGLMFITITVLRLLLLGSDARWIYFIILVWVRVLWVLGNLGLWTLAGRLFTSRQGKRLFSLIMAGGVFSIILVGFLNSSLILWLGTPNLLWITSASLLASLWLLIITARRFQNELIPREKDSLTVHKDEHTPGQSIFRDRYIWFIFLFTTLSTIGTYVLDYAFIGQAGAKLTDADQLGKFFGNYMGISTLVTLIVLLVVSNRFFSRFGVRGGLLVDPVLVAIGTIAVILLSAFPDTANIIFWVVVAVKMSDEVTVVAMNNTSVRIMYQPLSQRTRSRVQTAVESVIAPLSMGISGILLLLFTKFWNLTPLQAVYILAVILVGWLLMGILLGRQYYGALQKALDKRYLDDSEIDIFAESSGKAILEKYIQSDNHRDVLFAIELLAEHNPEVLDVEFPKLLVHSDTSVRRAAIHHLNPQDENTLGQLEVLIQDRDQPATIRAAALQRIGSLKHDAALLTLSPFLTDPNMELRRAATIGALQSNTLEGILEAGGLLVSAQNNPSAEDRCFAAQVMGAVGNTWFYKNLLPLLNDKEPHVRLEALRACRNVHHPQLWPLVVAALPAEDTRHEALKALIAGGEGALPFIADALHQAAPTPVACDLIRACGQIGGARVNQILQELISIPRERVRTEVLRVLTRNQYQADSDMRIEVIKQIDAEITSLGQLAHLIIELEKQPSDNTRPLLSILNQMIARNRMRIIDLLAMIYDAQDILRVQKNLSSNQKEKHANATEILDVMLSQDRKLRERVMPIIVAQTTTDLLKLAYIKHPVSDGELEEQLHAMYIQDDLQIRNNWLAACVIYALPELFPDSAEIILKDASQHPKNILRQTAQGLLQRRTKNDGESPMMLTIEKVLILKTVSIFTETPDEVLAELALYLEERDVAAGQMIFNKGEPGDSMYIIVSGKVRVHDGERTLNQLKDRDVFGEMALLDPAPRAASVTALEETRLLCLDHGPFYEAVNTRSEISRGVIKVLSRNLRSMVENA